MATGEGNTEQARIWNAAAGMAWVEHADHFDASLAAFGEAAISALTPQPGERVVDIGCGTGATTLRLAVAVAPADAVGVDLSAPMLEVGRPRAAAARVDNVRFEQVDVQADEIPGAPFDLAFSRFGVMFFSDPVLAFERIAAAMRPGGRLAFVCYGTGADNPFITAPVGAAMRVLGLEPAPTGSGGPGPFSMADPDATASLLASAGFVDVSVEPGPDAVVLGPDDDLDGIAARVIAQNPTTSAAFDQADDTTRAATLDAARAVLAGHCDAGAVRMPASTWVVTARRP